MTAPLNRASVFRAEARSLGYTRDNGSGCGSGTWQRWGLVPVDAHGLSVLRWRDGKARHVGPRVSGATMPQWLRRAAEFIKRAGPMRIHELSDVATWYQAHRVGEYPIERFATLDVG